MSEILVNWGMIAGGGGVILFTVWLIKIHLVTRKLSLQMKLERDKSQQEASSHVNDDALSPKEIGWVKSLIRQLDDGKPTIGRGFPEDEKRRLEDRITELNELSMSLVSLEREVEISNIDKFRSMIEKLVIQPRRGLEKWEARIPAGKESKVDPLEDLRKVLLLDQESSSAPEFQVAMAQSGLKLGSCRFH